MWEIYSGINLITAIFLVVYGVWGYLPKERYAPFIMKFKDIKIGRSFSFKNKDWLKVASDYAKKEVSQEPFDDSWSHRFDQEEDVVEKMIKLKSGYVVKKVDSYKTLYYGLVIIAGDERFVIQWYYFDKDGELCQYITTDQEFKDITEVWSGAWDDISCWLTYNIRDYMTTHLPGQLL